MGAYPTNPTAGQKIGANLCPRPTFPDVNRGAWSYGVVESREMSDYINGPDQPPAPTGIWVNRLGQFNYNRILLPGIVIGQSPPPIVSGGVPDWSPFIKFRITFKAATSPSGTVGDAMGVQPASVDYIGQDDYLHDVDELPPDGVYHWKTIERSLHVDLDGGGSGPGWQSFWGEQVALYIQTKNYQFGLHHLRVDFADGVRVGHGDDPTVPDYLPDYFDGATPDNVNENYAWDGTAYLSTSRAELVTVRDVAPPSAPLGLVVAGRTTTTIALDWNTATDNVGVTGYDVYEETQTYPYYVKLTATPVIQTAYTVTGLTPNTAHSYYVIAVDAARNESTKSATVTGITLSGDTTPPAAPTGLHTTRESYGAVDLAWNAATDNVAVTGYNAYRQGRVNKLNTTPIPQTAYSVTVTWDWAVVGDQEFFVTALDAAGNESADSSRVLVPIQVPPPPDTTAPTVPTTLAVVGVTHDTITLDWNAATDDRGVTGYNVYRGATKLTLTPITQTTYTATGLTPETVYTFTATALDAAGNESAHSVSATATTSVAPPPADTTPPSAPSEMFVTDITTTTANLAWWPASDDRGVIGYHVYAGETKLTTAPVAENTYTATGLTPATFYTFTVTAVDAAGNESAHSPAAITRTTVDDSPWGIHATLAATLAPRIAAYVGRPGDAGTIAAATEYVPVVAEYVRGYTRGHGFTVDTPAGPLQVVIVAATGRLVANPEQLTYYQTGDYTERPATLTGWTLAELGVLKRYRTVVA